MMTTIVSDLSYYLVIAAAIGSLFYWLLAGSRLFGLYLRWIDRLSIGVEDIQQVVNHFGRAIAWGAVALLFWALPFAMALAAFSCAFLFYQLLLVSKNTQKLIGNR